MTKSDYENLSLEALTAMRELRTVDDNIIRVRFLGKDAAETYAVVEDWSAKKAHAEHYFIMYCAESEDKPIMVACYSTMIQAMIRLSMSFVYDNCEYPDTRDAATVARSSVLTNTLCALSEMP